MGGGLTFIVFIAIAIALAIASYSSRQNRTKAIKEIANTMGFKYLAESSFYLPESMYNFDTFHKGRRRRQINNLIQRTDEDSTVSIGDYQYQTGSGKNTRIHRQTVVIIESDRLNLPSFLLIPEHLFHKVGKLFGYHDINFDTHPEFSSRYLLRGSHESSIRQRFHDGVLNFYQNHQGISSEGMGKFLIYYKQNHCVPPENWQSLLNECLEAYSQFSQQAD